ncbi:MAG TPA: ParB N-terminal domain-containing protein [Micromonosporaceae bacterium]|nr:ParB N-terminal domain-containing protein [Micromonosporaceae bacterium]
MAVAAAAVDEWQLVDVDPATLVLQDNVRLDPRLDNELIASVRERGVLQPIVAYRCVSGLAVLHGQRRALAAVRAGRASVRVVVVPAPGLVDRVVDQVVENDHREGITATERARAYQQLALLGLSAAQIARRTAARGPEVVAAGLAVAGSDRAWAAAVEHQLTLEQAAAVAEFAGDDQAVQRLVAAAERGGFMHQVQRLRDARVAAAERAAAAAPLVEAGLRVVDEPGYQDPARRLDLLRHDGVGLTVEAHASCPGHAAFLDVRYDDDPDGEGEDGGEPQEPASVWVPVYVCLDPAAHGHTSKYGVLWPSPAEKSEEQRERERERAERRDVIDSNRAWDSARKVRVAWLRTFLARRGGVKGTTAFAASMLAGCDLPLRQAMECRHQLAHELLGADISERGFGDRRGAAIDALLSGASEGRAQVVLLGLVLCALEAGTTRDSWRRPATYTTRYLRFIESQGYELSQVELRACGVQPEGAKGSG